MSVGPVTVCRTRLRNVDSASLEAYLAQTWPSASNSGYSSLEKINSLTRLELSIFLVTATCSESSMRDINRATQARTNYQATPVSKSSFYEG